MSRNRTILGPFFGGICNENETVEIIECNMHECPVDCDMGEWTDWGECSLECGTGSKKRTRFVDTHAAHGGKECGSMDEILDCNTFACPTPEPTAAPTPAPSAAPTSAPTAQPTPAPTFAPVDCVV